MWLTSSPSTSWAHLPIHLMGSPPPHPPHGLTSSPSTSCGSPPPQPHHMAHLLPIHFTGLTSSPSTSPPPHPLHRAHLLPIHLTFFCLISSFFCSNTCVGIPPMFCWALANRSHSSCMNTRALFPCRNPEWRGRESSEPLGLAKKGWSHL